MNGKQKVLQVVSNLKITLKERKLWCTLLNVYNKLELVVCLTENCEQNFLGGEKSASSLFVRSFRQSNRNSKGSEKIIGNSEREDGLTSLEFGRHWGVEYFGISEGKGLKCSCRPS